MVATIRRGMKELELRRLIPLAAVASLVTVGCGSDTKKLAKRTCELTQECSEEYFDKEFDSMSECVEYYQDYFDEYLDEAIDEYGEACANAYLDYVICTTEHLTCDYDHDDAYEKCDDEYDAYYDECDY